LNRFEAAFGEWVVKRRWWIILATSLIVLGVGSGVRFLTFNNDDRVFFSKENPQLKAFEALENTYTQDENVFFVVAPKDGHVFTRETLAAVEDLTEASWQIPFSSRVDSVTNFQHTRGEEDELIVENLAQNTESLSDADLKRIKKIALSEPLLVNRLISASGHVTGVNVNILKPGESMNESPLVGAFVRKMADNFRRKHADIDIYVTGGIIIDNAHTEAVIDDLSTLAPGVFLTLFILMGLLLRSFTGTFATLILTAFSAITGLGLAGWLGTSLSPPSVNAPMIIFTLAVADSVHILVTMFQQMRQGKTKHKAIAESVRVNLQPVFLTSVTTAIGFLSMNFSDAPPFRDLGNIVATGVIAAFLYSVFFLPAMMALLPVRVKPKANRQAFDRLADFIINRRRPLFWGILILIAVLATGILRIELDDNFVEFFDERYEFRRATDFLQENLTGFMSIEYSLDSGETGGINDPEYLAKVEEFANWYHSQPKVVHVNAITHIMKRLNKNMHGDDEAYYRIPEQRDLAAQYLLLYEMSLPFGLDLNNQINVDKSATRMIVTFKNASSRFLIESNQKGSNWLARNAPETMFAHGASMSIMFANISKRNIESMLGASFLALILISFVLMFALRTFKLGLVSLIPNITPAFIGYGLWGMMVGRVGLAVSVIGAMTLGIVVDDTVHFLSKYLRARREHGAASSEAVRYSFNTVGSALLITTVILVAGFSILSFSGFQVNSQISVMTIVTITLALGLDFFFLPTLLMKMEE
jgi:predicted RND superfamily exporter protein